MEKLTLNEMEKLTLNVKVDPYVEIFYNHIKDLNAAMEKLAPLVARAITKLTPHTIGVENTADFELCRNMRLALVELIDVKNREYRIPSTQELLEPSPSDVSTTQGVSTDIKKDELRDAKLKPKTVYTVTMYRYGNREWHSYVLGAFSSNDIAREWAVKEEEYRDGKYKAEIIRLGIDSPTDFLKEEL